MFHYLEVASGLERFRESLTGFSKNLFTTPESFESLQQLTYFVLRIFLFFFFFFLFRKCHPKCQSYLRRSAHNKCQVRENEISRTKERWNTKKGQEIKVKCERSKEMIQVKNYVYPVKYEIKNSYSSSLTKVKVVPCGANAGWVKTYYVYQSLTFNAKE